MAHVMAAWRSQAQALIPRAVAASLIASRS
jgi:hypothetical protein